MDSGLSPAEQAALSIDHQAYELLRRDCLDGFLPRETLLKRLNIPAELIDQFPSACQSLAARCRALRCKNQGPAHQRLQSPLASLTLGPQSSAFTDLRLRPLNLH